MVEEIENIQDKEEGKSEDTPLLVRIKEEPKKQEEEKDDIWYDTQKATKEDIEEIEIE